MSSTTEATTIILSSRPAGPSRLPPHDSSSKSTRDDSSDLPSSSSDVIVSRRSTEIDTAGPSRFILAPTDRILGPMLVSASMRSTVNNSVFIPLSSLSSGLPAISSQPAIVYESSVETISPTYADSAAAPTASSSGSMDRSALGLRISASVIGAFLLISFLLTCIRPRCFRRRNKAIDAHPQAPLPNPGIGWDARRSTLVGDWNYQERWTKFNQASEDDAQALPPVVPRRKSVSTVVADMKGVRALERPTSVYTSADYRLPINFGPPVPSRSPLYFASETMYGPGRGYT